MALTPEALRGALLDDVLGELDTPEDWKVRLKQMIGPMIERHRQMLPHLHQGDPWQGLLEPEPQPRARPQRVLPPRTEKYPGTGRNEPCPCGSGNKYKRCCGGSG